jgi:hypothetical protein
MPSPIVTVEAREAYELLMSLAAMADIEERGGYDIGEAWFDRARELAGPELIERIDRLSHGCGWAFGNILGLAIETPEPRDAPAFLAHLRAQDPRRLHLMLHGHTLRPFRRVTPPELLQAAVDGDRDARREVTARSFPEHPTWPGAVRGLLDLHPPEAAELLTGIVTDWSERVFAVLGPGLMTIAERDAAERRATLATDAPSEVIDRATRGWDYIPEPGVTHVVLAPSVVGRPWVTTADHGETRIFCYAVPDEAVVAAAAGDPPAFLVRRLRALADARRLRLLKRIGKERLTLNDLARELDVPKTTLHHHLAILRAAGLISLRHEARAAYSPYPTYVPRPEALPTAWEALLTWLGLGDG